MTRARISRKLPALCLAGLALQVIRLQAEEKLLGQDPVYAEYMAKVPYRLAPGLY